MGKQQDRRSFMRIGARIEGTHCVCLGLGICHNAYIVHTKCHHLRDLCVMLAVHRLGAQLSQSDLLRDSAFGRDLPGGSVLKLARESWVAASHDVLASNLMRLPASKGPRPLTPAVGF